MSSISKDKDNHKQGKSLSDQIMARALLTPDELRRMDNDECIIYEKGLKPIKARKFYYFKHPMIRKLQEAEISHNDIGEIERGVWRKYNPYNPYVEESKEQLGIDDTDSITTETTFIDDLGADSLDIVELIMALEEEFDMEIPEEEEEKVSAYTQYEECTA